MKPVSDTYHLQRRDSTWHYVRRVPKHLVEAVGKNFIKKSLGPVDKAEAKRLRAVEDIRTDALFLKHEVISKKPVQVAANAEPIAVGFDELTEHVRKAVAKLDRRATDNLTQEPIVDHNDRLDRIIDAEQALSILFNPADARHDQWIATEVDRLSDDAGIKLTDTEVLAQFADVVRRGLIEVQRRRLDRYNDRHDRSFHDALFDPARQSSVTFGDHMKTYLVEKLKDYEANGIREKSADRIRSLTSYLNELIGKTTLLQAVDDDVIQMVRGQVAKTPINRNKIYPGLSLAKQIEKAAHDGKPALSPQTQSSYLDTLRDVLEVARRKRLIPFNPAGDIKPLKRSTLNDDAKRKPWTLGQVKGFFTGHFYQSCAPNAPTPYSRPDRSWRFWLPLIMLFSGARPNEVLQLEVTDIRRTDVGTWFMDLQNEDASKQLKTETSRRRVPIHPELVRVGFLAFVEERRKNSQKTGQRLFPQVKPDKYGSYSDKPGKSFNRTFIKQEIILGDRQALYSLRHNVRDALRRAKAPPEALRLAGWSDSKSASDHYGDPGDPDLIAEHVAAISYPGLDLSFLHLPDAGLNGS